MAASTSVSIECSVPSTIWRVMGSTALSSPPAGEVPPGGAGRGRGPWSASVRLQNQVAEAVDLDLECRLDDGRRPVLLDDGGAAPDPAHGQVFAPVDGEPRPL